MIGWLFVISAALGILSGLQTFILVAFTKTYMMPRGTVNPGLAEEIPDIYGSILPELLAVSEHFRLIALGQLLLSAFILVAGINFLLLKAWARTALEAVSWVYLLLFLAVARIWHKVMASLPAAEDLSDSLGEECGEVFTAFVTLGRVAPVALIVLGMVLTLVMIALLRRRDVRTAMRSGRVVGL